MNSFSIFAEAIGLHRDRSGRNGPILHA